MLFISRLVRQTYSSLHALPSSRHFATSLAAMSTPSIPPKMRAILVQKQGDLDVIEQQEIDTPKPGPHQILIKMEYGGVNYIDTYFRGGFYKLPKNPFTLGQDGAGTVVAVGEGVKAFNVGDKVANFSPGSFAEYNVVPCHKAVRLSEGLDTRTAAAAMLQGLTALTTVKEAYPVQKGDWILVHAAAGGVGALLCQLCKAIGAHAIGTASTAEKCEHAKQCGAEYVINSKEENVVERVKELTNGKGCQAILDGVGKDTWEDNFKVIARKGTIVTYGNSSGGIEPFTPQKLADAGNVRLIRPTLFNYIHTQEEMDYYSGELFKAVKDGSMKFKVHKEYPFTADGVRQAQKDIMSRGTTGKLLIKIA